MTQHWVFHRSWSICSLLVANAISVWVNLQDRVDGVPVDEIAVSFGLTPDLVREAVKYHYWMYLDGNGNVTHDGE